MVSTGMERLWVVNRWSGGNERGLFQDTIPLFAGTSMKTLIKTAGDSNPVPPHTCSLLSWISFHLWALSRMAQLSGNRWTSRVKMINKCWGRRAPSTAGCHPSRGSNYGGYPKVSRGRTGNGQTDWEADLLQKENGDYIQHTVAKIG